MYKNGVYEGKDDLLVTEIQNVVGIHSELIRSPTFVLSDIAAKKIKRIVTRINNGEFNFTSVITHLPTSKHSLYFDVFCALFASNWNEKGLLYFTFSTILKEAGKSPNSRSRLIVAETIRRYMGCHAHWEKFQIDNDDDTNWSGSLIIESSIFDDDGNLKIKRIGTIKSKEDHHFIKFHPKVTEALDPKKNPRTRLFDSEIFKIKLTQPEYIIYRYFYGHWDTEEVWKSIFKPHEGLIDIFKWTSPKRKFIPWLVSALQGLDNKELIDYFKFNETETAIGVKCFSIKEMQDKRTIDLVISEPQEVTKGPRKGASKYIKANSKNVPPLKILEEYRARREQGLMRPDQIQVIDAALARYHDTPIPSHVIEFMRNSISEFEIDVLETDQEVLNAYRLRKETGLLAEEKIAGIEGLLSAFGDNKIPEFAIKTIRDTLSS